jgi:catalase
MSREPIFRPTITTQTGNETVERRPSPGVGGETHQSPDPRRGEERLTTSTGNPASDNQNSLKAGARGPVLLEDQFLREKIFHFDHERIPERVVHARGYGAHGYFEVTDPIPEFTRAALFQQTGQRTPVFVRFSTVLGNKGSFDLARDVRGFATKFYTTEGNWDLVGNNIPVFFVQDAMKFPDLVHAGKQEPDRAFPQASTAHDNFWDFISLMPESIHMIMWTMSDRAIPRSFRFMEGFGVHTFRFINAEGAGTFVKFHWKPRLGMQSVLWDEAVKINGADPDFHRRDLWESITSGAFPEWDLGVQLFDDDFADTFDFDVLDATKIIPEEIVPIRIVGKLVLDRMVDNFFAETEQVAFCTQNVVPGIAFTNDPLLQGRNFSYLDTQLKRLGSPNFNQLPINAPRCPFHHFQQDGHMAHMNPVGRANYEPNSWVQGGPREDAATGYRHTQETVEGETRKIRAPLFADHYSQARQFYLSQTRVEQDHIAGALVFELSRCEVAAIRERMVAHLPNIDADLARTVAAGLGIAVPTPHTPLRPVLDLPVSDALSILKQAPGTFRGRKLGLYLAEGADDDVVEALTDAVLTEGGVTAIVADRIGAVQTASGIGLPARFTLATGPSVLFDAIAILADEDEADRLCDDIKARAFVTDAFHHGKFIGVTGPARALLQEAGVDDDYPGILPLDTPEDADAFVSACAELRVWDTVS